jgi:hypothetical protein
MPLADDVRSACAQIARQARWVSVDLDALGAVTPGAAGGLDPERHFLDGDPEPVTMYLLTLNAVNFGSGWFPELRKREADGRPLSGYFTVAWALADRFRADGPWSASELRTMTTAEIAQVLDQERSLELMSLYAQALRGLGGWLGERRATAVVAEAQGSAQRLARELAAGMAMFNDVGFYKRAQITAHDLTLGGVARFSDLDELTAFADNLVPHVLRCEGVLVYEPRLAAHVDAGRHLRMGEAEREIRACAVHACELIAQRTGVPARMLDTWLWNRGQLPEYKSRPRHRTKTVFY